MTRGKGERGSATLWLISGCLLLFLAGSVVTLRASAVLARHRAETAADLAALAAATRIGTGTDPCAAARRIATANGASLLACRAVLAADGRTGTVDVRAQVTMRLPALGSRQASATARAGRFPAATSPSYVSQHEIEEPHGPGLVERVVSVAALGRLHA